ncbi:histone acetyltransferase HPA2 and related acetyltransferase [Candidatus Moduliflexus flocculans]|uniref:Histone acetyltransferase HPA2 and related acetyltransferase n=1 Tax=Candidatus Moduliflexus flocculans TaxID=1499966 RepID=A0A0S6VRW9_9BACT|nr:histone acetyltransferase HPA2 and related acetyltransferase [Candidatus Moduliflexus flocculans]
MADVRIRPMTVHDAEAIVNIFNPIIATHTYTVFDTPLTVEAEREFLANFSPRGIFHVAELRDRAEIVGFQSLDPFAPYTHACDHVGVIGTYTALTHHGKGIGQQLSQATFAAAKTRGYEKIFAYVRADNPYALHFYLKLGFTIIGIAKKHAKFPSGYVDEILIEKFL